MRHDAIVVGAGHQGLVAAVRLARAGWRTIVVERNDRPGGAVMSAEITRPGFVHDLFSTNQNLFLASPLYAELRTELERHGLRYAVSAKPYANAFPCGGSLRVYQDAERTMASLRAHDAGDAEGWEALGRLFARFSPALFALYSAPLPSWRSAREALGASRRLRRDGLYELVRLLLSSTRELGDAYFASREAKAMLACWGMHLDFGPDVSGGAMFPFLEAFADQAGGMAVVEGGASRMIDALVGLLRESGGELWTGAEVTQIEVAGGRARGVELAGGERLDADVVVCNPDLPVVYRTLLGGLDAPRAARRGRYSPSCLLWVAGVRGAPPDGAAHHNIHFGRQWDESFRALIRDGDVMPDPSILVTLHSLDDASLAPPGCSTLYALEPTPNLDGRVDWTAHRERAMERLRAQVAAAGYPVEVVTEEVYDPLDWEAMGMERGTPFALAHTFRQTGPFRPRNVDRRVPGLVFVGSSTVPGVGVPMVLVSGKLAADRVEQFAVARGKHR